jgi:hypothetical protein
MSRRARSREGGVTAHRVSEERRRRRERSSRRAVAAATALARENGLRVEEPVVLNDLFSLMAHLKPAPVRALGDDEGGEFAGAPLHSLGSLLDHSYLGGA